MLPVVGSSVRLKIFSLLEAREQVGEELGFDAQFLALGWVHPRRRVERHGDVVIAVHVEHDMAKQLEILTDLLVAVDVIEARQDFDDGAALGGLHLRHQAIETVRRSLRH